jgi:2-keto-4-pentenoate hydratase/2-oxohepta-3-ene-1,7-dioic acid hydratase in catechol pathway
MEPRSDRHDTRTVIIREASGDPMRLVTFMANGFEAVGALDLDNETVVNLSLAAPDLPREMTALIDRGEAALVAIRGALERPSAEAVTALSQVRLLAPIPRPRRNIICVGRNYYDHAREFHDSGFDATADATAMPDVPIIFTKATTSVIGPGDDIPGYLDPSGSVDYEAELAIVIGAGGRGISKASAYDHIYGYTIINDVTARSLQKKHKQWFIGKSLDGFCPMGPCLVTADEIGDVDTLHMTTHVNGEERQNALVADLIFDIPTLVETISAGITLLPGDIIATGTPVGVGIGFDPPIFLKAGDVVSITVDRIGELRNTVA